MHELTATMTEQGQITIPDEVRHLLGLKPHDKVAFEIEDGEVRLVPAGMRLEDVFGSVPARVSEADFDDEIRRAKDERAAATVRKMSRS